MSGFMKDAPAHLVRSNVWSDQLKEVLQDELMATSLVSWMSDFPDGDTFNIPSIGDFQADNYTEGEDINYRALDTGNYTFTISEYLSSATYITKKAMQDQYYMSELVGAFVPKQRRAIMARVEKDVLNLQSQQTASDLNSINGAAHRFVGTGTAPAADAMAVDDIARALFSLKKANVGDGRLVAIVDPSVEYTINTISNLTNVSNNPRWEGVIADGIAKGMRFVKNIYGFDILVSNRLASGISETIDSDSVTNGVANLFMNLEGDEMPFKGAWRQMPEVDSDYNKDKQREEYVTTARYGLGLYRPEGLVVCITDRSIVS